MRTILKTISFIAITTSIFFFTSCEKDDINVSEPVISDLEVGISNNHIAYVGADLHLEAEIEAAGRINTVMVEIHQEEGSSDEITATYDDYVGLKNATFHKHVDIPEGTPTGTYHVHIIVTDQDGNQTTVEDEIEIQELADEEAPEITISSAPESGTSFSNGETITISGNVTDNISLEGMLVALVYASDNIDDADVSGSNASVIVMLHTHDFEDPDEHEFTASIVVGAENDNNMTPAPIQGNNAWKSGNYYVVVKSTDAKKNTAVSSHYPITINL